MSKASMLYYLVLKDYASIGWKATEEDGSACIKCKLFIEGECKAYSSIDCPVVYDAIDGLIDYLTVAVNEISWDIGGRNASKN